MAIYLENLSVKQIEKELNITLSDTDKDKLETMREANASNIPKNKWHCFHIPFIIQCGSMETAIKVRDILAPYQDKMEGSIEIAIGQ